MIDLVPATPAHVGTIAARMREWDVREAAVFGRTPKQSLRVGLMASLWTLTARVDGRPEAMIGLSPVSMIEGRGQPWMLGTEAIYAHPREMIRNVRPLLARMREDCPRLENRVAVGNARARRFLAHVGFQFGEGAEDIGGLEMVRFFMA